MVRAPRPPGRRSDRPPVGGAPVGGARDGGAPVGGARDGGAPDGGAPVGGARDGGAPVGGARDGGARPGAAADPGAGAGGRASLGELVARVATDQADPGDRRRQLGALIRALGGAARAAGAGARGLGQLLADTLTDAAPRIPVRDAATLRYHHPGRSDDEIADALVRSAGRSTGTFGAALGALAAVEFAAPPSYLVAPVQLAAETLAVAAVEVKLIAELHELYGEPAVGSGTQRAAAYLTSWMHQRAVDPQVGAAGLSAVLGFAAKGELRTLLMRRMGRSTTKLAPFLAGAVAGAAVNRRVTRNLADRVAAELRGRHPTVLSG